MAKKNAVDYHVEVFGDGHTTLQGDIISQGKETTKIRYRRSGSKKYEERIISNRDVIATMGEQGSTGAITFKDKQKLYDVMGVVEDNNNGFITVHTEKGPLQVRAENARAIAVAEEPPEKLKPETQLKNTGPILVTKIKKQLSEKAKASAKKNLEKAKGKRKVKRKD